MGRSEAELRHFLLKIWEAILQALESSFPQSKLVLLETAQILHVNLR